MKLLVEDFKKLERVELAFVENEDGTYTMIKNRRGIVDSEPVSMLVIPKERVNKNKLENTITAFECCEDIHNVNR